MTCALHEYRCINIIDNDKQEMNIIYIAALVNKIK